MTDFSYEVTVPLIHNAGVIRSEHHVCKEGGGRGAEVYWLIGFKPAQRLSSQVG